MNKAGNVFIAILLAAIAAEMLIMLFIARFSAVPSLTLALLDSLLLALLLAPVVYILAARKAGAEAALRESEEKFRSVFNHASDIILLLDIPPEGVPVIADVNDTAVSLLGFSRGELISKPVSILDPGLTEEVMNDRRRKAEAGIPFTVKHPCKDGTVREFESASSMITIGGKSLAVSVERDITDRRKAEEELRFRATLLDNASDAIQALELDGTMIYVNETVVRTTGYSRDELLGKSISMLDSSGDAPLVQSRLEQLLRDGSANFNMLRMRKDGTSFPVEVYARVIDLAGRKIVVAMDRDITERRRDEEALAATRRRQEAILDNIPDIAWLKDRESRFIAVNQAFAKSCGLPAEALPGKTDLDIWPKELAERYRADDEEVMRSGKRKQVEEPLATKDGKSMLIETIKMPILDDSGRIIGTTGIARDVTERARTEADTRESCEIQTVLNSILQRSLTPLTLKQKLADHLAALFSIPWLAVQPKGAVFLATGKTLVLTAQQGLAPALLTACARVPFGKCLCGRAAESGRVAASDCLGPEHEIIYEGMAAHGHYCAPIMAAGKVLGVLNLYLMEGTAITGKRKDFIQAVTDIIAAEILHARVEEQFIHAQKMEAVGHMAGGVAHDFNNILTAIMGYADFLRRALPAGDPNRADVEEIIKAGERAAALTQQLLTFSRKQVVEVKVLDLDQAVPGIVKMIRRMIPEDIEFRTFLNSAPAAVQANQGQLGQVLINLAVNARDAMPEGGTLTFETAQAELDADYAASHPGVSPGRYVMLAVSDTGHGMSPEVVERIFEPFFTTKEQGKGTGLGLSTVYGIVKQSGGSIFVYSEPGKGTAFKIYLPRVAERTELLPAEEPAPASLRGTETVLVVEDDESIRRLLVRVLSQNGYAVLEAATPRQAVKLCEQRRDIRLMITDIIMPQMNGYELSKIAARLAPLMKVIFMSGYTDNALPKENISGPGWVFLEKPLKVETVLRKIREVLEGKPQ